MLHYLNQWGVQRVVVVNYRVVRGSIVGYQEGPATTIAAVLVAAVQQIAVEEQGIARIQLYLDQRQNLHTRPRTSKYT